MQPLEKRTTNLSESKLPHFQPIMQTSKTFSFISPSKRGIIPSKQVSKTGIIPKNHLIHEKSVIAK